MYQNHNSCQHSFIESSLFYLAPARTTLQKARMRTRQHSTENPTQKATDGRKPTWTCCLAIRIITPPAQPHRKPTASSGTRQHSFTESPLLFPAAQPDTRQDSLTESPDENPPTQPHKNPIQTGTDSQKTHMQCCCFCTIPASTASQKAHCFFRHRPGQPYRKPT